MISNLHLNILNEYDVLKKVMVGPADTLPPLVPINATQRYYYQSNPPQIDIIRDEHKKFVSILAEQGIDVLWAQKISGVDQRDIRDIAAVIADKLFVCRVKEKIREREKEGIQELIKSLGPHKVVVCDEGLIEGGDVVIDNDVLFVGIGLRTDYVGYEILKEHFCDQFNIVALEMNGEKSLHLDTVFSICSERLGLIYAPAFSASTLDVLSKRYTLIETTDEEQFNLATNVLALSPTKIVADAHRNSRVVHELENYGIEIIDIKFSETNKIGGSFRCGTLPLQRIA